VTTTDDAPAPATIPVPPPATGPAQALRTAQSAGPVPSAAPVALVSLARLAGRSVARTAVRGVRLLGACHCNYLGLVMAVLWFGTSVTPSLLPRTWVIQGLISGVSASLGYALGTLLSWPLRFVPERWRPGERIRRIAWGSLAVFSVTLVTIALIAGSVWQHDLHELMHEPSGSRTGYAGVLLVSVLVPAFLIAVARLLRGAVRLVARQLARWVPASVARIVALSTVISVTLTLLHGVAYEQPMSYARSAFRASNAEQGLDGTPPASPLRSGGPGSLVSWRSLGMEGRKFAVGGPKPSQLTAFSGRAALEPIRVYAGLDAGSIQQTTALAVAELERTGAFTRSVLCVVTTTGTGWIDPYAAASLEYMYNGDSAIVGTQYSYVPSWMSFISERDRVEEAGRELFSQVYAVWSQLPDKKRPKLLVFAESLGSLGSEAAFRDVSDVRARTDGVLWIGPTASNHLRAEITKHRDAGTPAVLPGYDQDPGVRFASSPQDLGTRPAELVYLQNPSDPVGWWSPGLIVRPPEWLRERRGSDVLPAMRWYPLVTFLQVTADLALAYTSPPGHGHRYDHVTVAAWASLAGPAGWSPARTVALARLLHR
jgi:uncharacterized membrane protein